MRHPETIEAFADWCARKDPDEIYIWASDSNCACAQYARDVGMTDRWQSRDYDKNPNGFWSQMSLAACLVPWHNGPLTFGKLTKHLQAQLA